MIKRIPQTTSYTSTRKTGAVDKCHLLYAYKDPQINLLGVVSWHSLGISIVQFKTFFLYFFDAVFYITQIVHVWWDILVKGVCMTVREETTTDWTRRATDIRLWRISAIALEIGILDKIRPPTIVFSDWFISACRNGHTGVATKTPNDNHVLLAMTYRYSKLMRANLTPKTIASHVASSFIDKRTRQYGIATNVLTDNGTQRE